ncbi:hypothetical protein K491DRAFT_676686 [Lophiostoma macrostomum CBS 122681]|uniref:Uncharacterized protein n=1 Tax=Lophiostoma macrostomum CBS 122681 TaxID=1314788 RepID=A0A6A6TDI7_9PLEO|nr:hypothetical protein K491DRAFT_676686 [Lophiostoma macrostomum CBS 122681]
MQRSPAVCRRAARPVPSAPQPFVWISDDALSDALRRFSRFGCVQQRRPGSHVPGPLEARRRAVRRRMTVQAHAPLNEALPWAPNFTAWFRGRSRREPDWRYEAPAPPVSVDPLANSATPPDVDKAFERRGVPQLDSLFSAREDRSSLSSAETTLAHWMKADDRSSRRDVVAEAQKTIDKTVYSNESDADIGQVGTGTESLDYAQTLRASSGSTRCQEPTRGNASTPDPYLVEGMQQSSDRAKKRSRKCAHILLRRDAVGHPSERYFVELFPAAQPQGSSEGRRFLLLLRELDTIPKAQDANWVMAAFDALLYYIQWKTKREIPRDILRQDARVGSRTAAAIMPRFVASLLSFMRQHSIPYNKVAELSLQLAYVRGGYSMVLNLLRTLLEEGINVANLSFLQRLLFRAVDGTPATVQDLSAYDRQTHARLDLIVQAVKDLEAVQKRSQSSAPARVSHALEARVKFQFILRGALDARILPSSYTVSSIDSLFLQRSIVIDNLVHQYSLLLPQRPNQTRRSIQYLLKYLHDQHLPVTSSFVKSVVRGCIIRPMADGTFVDACSLIWVLRKVAEVEGPAAARRLEHTFWKWRGELIEDAHQKTGGSKRQGKARINQVKRLGL